MEQNIVYLGIDPGMGGGFSFLENNSINIYATPLLKSDGKKDYDIKKMAEILREYSNKRVICYIEAVFSMTAQGVSSSFNFGRGKGIWEGLAHAFNFEVHMVSPQTWKKEYDGLIYHVSKEEKEANKLLSKKEIERKKRAIKAGAKTKARLLASSYFPDHSKEFEKVNSDGKAESVLIAMYGKKKQG